MAESQKKRERKPLTAPFDNKMKGFSKGERDLYREVAKIKGLQEQQRLEEAERTRAVSTQARLACKLV